MYSLSMEKGEKNHTTSYTAFENDQHNSHKQLYETQNKQRSIIGN